MARSHEGEGFLPSGIFPHGVGIQCVPIELPILDHRIASVVKLESACTIFLQPSVAEGMGRRRDQPNGRMDQGVRVRLILFQPGLDPHAIRQSAPATDRDSFASGLLPLSDPFFQYLHSLLQVSDMATKIVNWRDRNKTKWYPHTPEHRHSPTSQEKR